MKKLLFVCLLSAGIVVRLNAQTNSVTNDSTGNKTINVYNPASVTEQTVTIADTTNPYVGISVSDITTGYKAPSRGTETIRIYSGGHEGNNVVRKVEVQLPEGR